MQSPDKRISSLQQHQQALVNRLWLAKQQTMKRKKQQYLTISQTLHMVSPLATLDRGFSITRNKDEKIMRNANEAAINEPINIQLSSGSLQCTIDAIVETKQLK